MKTYKIRNWSAFQHFKDRTPPWIKLYRSILDDRDWHALDPAAAKSLVMLWLIASEDKTHEGRLPDATTMAFRLRIPEDKMQQHIGKLSQWIESDDIAAISSRNHGDTPETETETETEGDRCNAPVHNGTEKQRKVFQKPSPQDVTDYAATINYKLEGQRFYDHYETNGWMVGRNHMKDWRAAVRTWKARDPANTVPTAAPRKQAVQSYTVVMVELADRLAIVRGNPDSLARALSAARDKYRDFPRNHDGKHVVDAALAAMNAKYNNKGGAA